MFDPLAARMAGQEALASSRRRAQAAPEGSERKYKVGKMAIRTRWFDDQIEAALGMPVSGASLAPGPLGQRLPVVRLVVAPPNPSPTPRPWRLPAAATIPGVLRAASAPSRVDLPSYVWSHPDGHEPRQLVMLGTGMDSRPWRMKLPAGGLHGGWRRACRLCAAPQACPGHEPCLLLCSSCCRHLPAHAPPPVSPSSSPPAPPPSLYFACTCRPGMV